MSPFEEAKQMCEQNNSYLLAPRGPDDLQRLANDLELMEPEVTWLDARVRLQSWHWTAGNCNIQTEGPLRNVIYSSIMVYVIYFTKKFCTENQ